MVFSLREAVGGIKHIGVGVRRKLSRRPDAYFVPGFQSRGIPVKRFSSQGGTPAICSICGYAMIRLELPNGWSLDTCSAMPSITAFESKQFADWANELCREKLPTARV